MITVPRDIAGREGPYDTKFVRATASYSARTQAADVAAPRTRNSSIAPTHWQFLLPGRVPIVQRSPASRCCDAWERAVVLRTPSK